VSQILISIYTEKLYAFMGRKTLNKVGLILMLICGAAYWFLTPEYRSWVYVLAFVSGISLSICLNTGISYICDVVGDNGK